MRTRKLLLVLSLMTLALSGCGEKDGQVAEKSTTIEENKEIVEVTETEVQLTVEEKYEAARMILEKDEVTEEEYAMVYEYLQEVVASESLNTDAYYYLGEMYYYGNGIEQDYVLAMECFERGMNEGHLTCQIFFAEGLEYGRGIVQDCEKAMEIYEDVANKGDSTGWVRMGDYYRSVETDYAKTFEYYKKAAEAGDMYGLYNLGIMYYRGIGVETNYGKAFELFQQSAELGYDAAMYWTGYCYDRGEGVVPDKSKAEEWYLKSAEIGNTDAMYNLAWIYYYKEDFDAAKKWAENASENGNVYAGTILNELKNIGD